MKGKGHYADQVADLFRIARKRFITAQAPEPMSFELFRRDPGQLSLF
jgi:hypothetical protein